MRFKTQSLVALLLTYVVSLSASAAIISVTPNDNGNGSITLGTINDFDVQLDKVYDSIGPMQIDIVVDSNGFYELNEVIINQTGITWTDFHWDLGGETDGSFNLAVAPAAISPFTDFNLSATSLDVFDGLLPDGNNFQPSIAIELTGSTAGAFLTLTQFPTIAVPEPTTLALMGISLAGIGYQRRRNKKAA